jgi:hypothetical protein
VVFEYCISLLIMTFKRTSGPHLIRPGEGTFGKSLPWTLVALFFGWWGVPWGLIYTPAAIIKNLSGGRDVTFELLAALESAAA